MPFPDFDFCLICDGVRPEVGAKVTILGFYGLAPDVEILVGNPALPVTLAFIAGFPPVHEAHALYQHSIIVTRPDQNVLVQTPPMPLNVSPAQRGFVVSGFVISAPYPFGRYSIRILVNNQPKLDTFITVRAPSHAERAAMSGIVFPPPPGRPN